MKEHYKVACKGRDKSMTLCKSNKILGVMGNACLGMKAFNLAVMLCH